MNYSSILNPEKNATRGKNGSSKSSETSEIVGENHKVSKSHSKLRLQELEETNINLENLVKRQSNELTEVSATNNKFISIIAHDLRGPFASIIGVLEILSESLNDFDENEIKKFVSMASGSAHSTLNLLDSLLTWTISQNKERSFDPVKINLNELIAFEIESFTTSAAQKQISIHQFILPNLFITADLQMVKTVLRNLISNAIKYTKTGGTITLSARETEPFVEISIKDNGVGISAVLQRKLFKKEAFQSTVGTNNERGTGLGLLLCKEFVETHGGKIWAESNPCIGSEFKFTLPHYI